ncbi:hypothetical protein WJX74_002801 [Apatococcus lobatus]|uniref:Rab-GAP TBC domain-containing protein n=1 Tax=Apatococcus lobatus TaxID=904363 RepID=A0AAW1RGR7_9CHLO
MIWQTAGQTSAQAVLKAATKELLEADPDYWRARQRIKAQVCHLEGAPDELEASIIELLTADDGANLIRNKAFGLSQGLLQPLQPIPANVIQPPATAKDCYPTLPAGLDAWQRFIVSRLHHLRARAGVPLAGKQQDLQKHQRKVAKDGLTAAQRIGLARATPPPATPSVPPVQQLWQLPQATPPSPTKGSGSSSLYRPKDLYEPLRQLLISPPPADTDKSAVNLSYGHEQARHTASGSHAAASGSTLTPRRASASVPGGSAAMDAVMGSLSNLKSGPDATTRKAASTKLPTDGEAKTAGGGHCRTLAEDLAYTWQDLQEQFQALAPHVRQVGVDDECDLGFKQERGEEGEAVLAGASIPAIRAFLCNGAPGHLRLRLWMAALGHTSSHMAGPQGRFEGLCRQVELRPLFTDLLVEDDINMISNQEQFFVFEETIRAVLLAFSRDPLLVGACQERPFPNVNGMGRHGQTHGVYPPSGVLPFRGMAFWVAPLCYLSQDPKEIYSMAMTLFCRHWSRLLSFTPARHPAALPCLAATFHLLVHEAEPQVTKHIESLGITPLQLVLPWLLNAFADQLPVDQLLLLWDRIIAQDSLLPLPMLALAVFVFRREVLLAARSANEVVDTMHDMSYMKVVPLLQAIIFSR